MFSHLLFKQVRMVCIGILLCLPCLIISKQAVSAQAAGTYPDRQVTLVVPWSPGAIIDNVGRRLAQHLSDLWGQTVVIKNAPGGGGNIAAASVARSPADGYTLMLTLHDGLIIADAANMDIGFDPLNDLAAVGYVGPSVVLLVVPQNSQFKDFKQLIEY